MSMKTPQLFWFYVEATNFRLPSRVSCALSALNPIFLYINSFLNPHVYNTQHSTMLRKRNPRRSYISSSPEISNLRRRIFLTRFIGNFITAVHK
ncbi:hypothetical protein ABKN59_002349 [Abortiporus biennis]